MARRLNVYTVDSWPVNYCHTRMTHNFDNLFGNKNTYKYPEYNFNTREHTIRSCVTVLNITKLTRILVDYIRILEYDNIVLCFARHVKIKKKSTKQFLYTIWLDDNKIKKYHRLCSALYTTEFQWVQNKHIKMQNKVYYFIFLLCH